MPGLIDFEAGLEFLSDAGLNLCALLDAGALPASIRKSFAAADIPLHRFQRLVLLGHGGRRLWTALAEWGWHTADPVDHYSKEISRCFIHQYLHDPPMFWLYPQTPALIPLQQLGRLAGWSYPSPLGQDINPQFGVWFAYRSAFLVDADLPLRADPPQQSPCVRCPDKPCIIACPVDAVGVERFDIAACSQFRLRPGSSCADRCLARMACPYFREHRYSLPQIQYHYRHSLRSLRAWYNSEER